MVRSEFKYRLLYFSLCASIVLCIVILILLFGGCTRFTYCLYAEGAYIVGSDEKARSNAATAMKVSAARFSDMTGARALPGTIMLDRSLSVPIFVRFFSLWRLPYYPANDSAIQPSNVMLESGAMEIRPATGGEDAGSPVLTPEGTLSHEICHQLAKAQTRGRRIPMAFEEMIAVGCEEKRIRDSRIELGISMKVGGGWSSFLMSDHPLNVMLNKQSEKELETSVGVTNFEIPAGTIIQKEVSKYYSRVAILQEYLEHSCGDRYPIGRLLRNISISYDFDVEAWMKKHRNSCFEGGSEIFSLKVDGYVSSLVNPKVNSKEY